MANFRSGLRRIGGIAKRKSPEICLVVGALSFVATVASACRATLKIKTIVDEAKSDLKEIDEHPVTEKYTQEDKKSDRRIVYVQSTVKVAKELVVPALCAFTSFKSVFKSYKILTARNSMLVGLYMGLKEKFDKYRDRVADKLGEEEELKIAGGLSPVEVTTDNGKGKIKKSKYDIAGDPASPFIRYFCSDNPEYEGHSDPNSFFFWLHCEERVLESKRKARWDDGVPGHVSFNEMLTAYGFKPNTDEGLVCGNMNKEIKIKAVPCKVTNRFGEIEDGYMIDFNVEGVIYHEQEKAREKLKKIA